MKIVIKTLDKRQFLAEIDPQDTVLVLKHQLEQAHGFTAATQNLIFQGKVLSDGQTIESCGMVENSFLVLLITKPKPQPPVFADSSKDQANPDPPVDSDAVVAGLVEMGFEKSSAVSALEASLNDPIRAVEYLLSEQDSELHGNLDFLRADPQFVQIRDMVRQNPQLLRPLLQQIGATNPQLLQLLNENQEELASLFRDNDQDDDQDSIHQEYIQVTREEKESIDRLVALGFEKARVVQVFFACDKDETLAANFLFDNVHDQ